MIAAAHLDNFLFLIFFAIAILFQLLTRAASKTGRRRPGDQKQRPPQTPRSLPRQPEDSEEDRIRKFLEALGQPTSSQPPPPVSPRPTYQKPTVLPRIEPREIARRVLSPLPPLTTRPAEFEPEVRSSERQIPPATPKRERRVFQPQSEIATFEGQEGPRPPAAIAESETPAISGPKVSPAGSKSEARIDIPILLKSTSGLRNAMILREIFGPPRSLQRLDLVENV